VDIVGVVLAGRNQDYENLDNVSRLPALRRLIIQDAELTPKAIAALSRLGWLEELTFSKSQVTDEQIAELKHHLPHTLIVAY
jgi:hypothetical protein